jgi:hypothetical protein
VPAVQFSAAELMALIFTRDLARPLGNGVWGTGSNHTKLIYSARIPRRHSAKIGLVLDFRTYFSFQGISPASDPGGVHEKVDRPDTSPKADKH